MVGIMYENAWNHSCSNLHYPKGGSMSRIWIVFFIALFLIFFQNCSPKVNFDSPAGESSNSSTNPNPDGSKTDSFKVTFNSESAPLDMIWVVDNSGSMREEAASVQKNFDAFLTALNKSTNFRLLLLSGNKVLSGGTGVEIPANFDPNTHRQVLRTVDSNNGPRILLEVLQVDWVKSFLRANSKKIIVFVTDDESSMKASEFYSKLQTDMGWSAEDIAISSFIGLGKDESPCQDTTGAVYKNLATVTKGLVYNICAPDWSGNFSNLLNASVSKASRRFTLGQAAVQAIIEVRVNGGAALASNMYSLSGNVVTLADTVELPENSQVLIQYR